jgi:hypothetical protein
MIIRCLPHLRAATLAVAMAAIVAPGAHAQSDGGLTTAFAKPHPVPMPKPWPMHHLIKNAARIVHRAKRRVRRIHGRAVP